MFASGKTKWISTGCDTRAEAEKVLTESGVERLSLTAKAGRLTHKAIGQILTGRNLTCLKALEQFQKLKRVSQASKTVHNSILVVGNWMKEARIETLPPSAVTAAHIGKWMNNPELKWKRSTRQVALASVRNFFRFCADNGRQFLGPLLRLRLQSILSSRSICVYPDLVHCAPASDRIAVAISPLTFASARLCAAARAS